LEQADRETFWVGENGGGLVEIVVVAESASWEGSVSGSELDGERVKKEGEEVPANARQNVQGS